MQRAIFITFAAVLTLSALHPAYADEANSKRVSLAGIDASTQHGADQILRRIRHAAWDVCDVRTGAQPIAVLRAEQQCVHDAISRSVAELNDPNVNARYARENATVFASR